MDPLMQFFTWQFMLFSMAIAGVTYVIRLLVEYFLKNTQKLKLWKDVLLPIFPIVLGVLMGAFMVKYPYPEGLVSAGSRIVFGLVAGMFSGVLYRVIIAMLNFKAESPNTTPTGEQVTQEVIDSVKNSIQK